MNLYLEYIYRLFYPACTVLEDAAPPEYEAILRLADLAERVSRYGRGPGFFEVWSSLVGDIDPAPPGADEIELRNPGADRSPIFTIRRGPCVVRFSAPAIADVLQFRRVMLVSENPGNTDVCREVVILPNRHGPVAHRFGDPTRDTWRVTDWTEIAGVLARLADTRDDRELAAWARFLRDDFRPGGAVRFAGEHTMITIDDLLRERDSAMYGLPEGITGLLHGSSRELLVREVARLSDSDVSPGRYVLPGPILRAIVEGRLNGRWSELPWDTLRGSWPRWAAERIATGSARPLRILPEPRSTAPWDPVQLAFRSV